ncbi:MAG: 2-hydroxyacid dehydrogenase [Leptolyngbyaceae cyanobacterium]
MAISLICPTKDPTPWLGALRQVDSSIDIRLWPDDQPREQVDFILTWAHPPGVFQQYPNLRVISSMGAGGDALLQDPEIPTDVAIVRVVDSALVADMESYAIAAVINHVRRFPGYSQQQQQRQWQTLMALPIQETTIGVMGLGQIGGAIAQRFASLRFPVRGWSRAPKDIPGIQSFYGKAGLNTFLAETQILICLLPLTPNTRHILNTHTLSQLPTGAYLINMARGGHLIEADLITLVDKGHLSGACLDVFQTEPLPENHPFWSHPNITVTPHIASITQPTSVAAQIIENYQRLQTNRPLQNRMDRQQGY